MATATRASTRAAAPRGGRGRQLTAAFEEAQRFPALREASDRALEMLSRGAPSAEVAAAVEPDVGLTIAVVRAAGMLPGRERVRSVVDAVDRLGPGAVEAAVRAAPTHDFFEVSEGGRIPLRPDPFRLHAVQVQRAADRIAEQVGLEHRDELALAALLHDVGRPVLARLHPNYVERFDRRTGVSEERLAAERRELGIDHALVGGVLARRWGIHGRVAEAIERHHSPREQGAAAVICVADMLVAYVEDAPVARKAFEEAADRCGLEERELRRILYEFPLGAGQRRRASAPCPLSSRELEVLRRLAEGKVYKQIAAEMSLSPSTVRSHLHNVYGKLGALDRAQAVLMATDHGWI